MCYIYVNFDDDEQLFTLYLGFCVRLLKAYSIIVFGL